MRYNKRLKYTIYYFYTKNKKKMKKNTSKSKFIQIEVNSKVFFIFF